MANERVLPMEAVGRIVERQQPSGTLLLVGAVRLAFSGARDILR